VWRDNGEDDTAGVTTKAPGRHELTDDAADWLTQRPDRGTGSAGMTTDASSTRSARPDGRNNAQRLRATRHPHEIT